MRKLICTSSLFVLLSCLIVTGFTVEMSVPYTQHVKIPVMFVVLIPAAFFFMAVVLWAVASELCNKLRGVK